MLTFTEPPQISRETFLLMMGELTLDALKIRVYSGTVFDPGHAAKGLSLYKQKHVKASKVFETCTN